MIRPVTFQGRTDFNANLYALEVKSRFIDQNNANGYYTNYGSEVDAQIVGQTIQVGTGALVVQARMFEITAPETVRPQIFDGFKGYVVARIETYHPADDDNVTIIAKVQTSFEALDRELEKGDVYAADADNVNTAYELPIYSFEISGTQIVNLKKLIKPVCDYATMKAIVDNALVTAQNAVTTANKAVETSNDAQLKAASAVKTAGEAETKAEGAVSTANAAAGDAAQALEVANNLDGQIKSANETAANAVETANTAQGAAEAATEKVGELEKQIAEKQGTKVTLNGEAQATFAADDLVHKDDKIKNAAHADNADTATEAEAAKRALYAMQAAEAEQADGYTKGGKIDREIKSILARLVVLEGGK